MCYHILYMSLTVRKQLSYAPLEARHTKPLLELISEGRAALLGPSGKAVLLPESVQSLLKQSLEWMAAGHSVRLAAEDQVITTQRAADILGMSRPSFVKFLESGHMGTHKVGVHRRVFLRDVMNYAKQREEASEAERQRRSILTKAEPN